MPVKMFFFSSEQMEVGQLTRAFKDAGIPCHVRKAESRLSGYETQAELWVDNARDSLRALKLCAQRRIGFDGQGGRQNSPIPPWRKGGSDAQLS